MYPPIFVVDHRIGPDPVPAHAGRHRDRPHIRRSQPTILVLEPSRHDAPHGPADAVIPVVPDITVRRALLIELAADPRFARGARPPARPGLRLWIGKALMHLGWRLVRQNNQGRQAG